MSEYFYKNSSIALYQALFLNIDVYIGICKLKLDSWHVSNCETNITVELSTGSDARIQSESGDPGIGFGVACVGANIFFKYQGWDCRLDFFSWLSLSGRNEPDSLDGSDQAWAIQRFSISGSSTQGFFKPVWESSVLFNFSKKKIMKKSLIRGVILNVFIMQVKRFVFCLNLWILVVNKCEICEFKEFLVSCSNLFLSKLGINQLRNKQLIYFVNLQSGSCKKNLIKINNKPKKI